MPARGAEFAFRDRQWNVTKELEASQIDARAAWKTEVSRVVGSKIDEAEVAEHQRQIAGVAILGIGVLACEGEIHQVAAIHARRHIPNFQRLVTKRAVSGLHNRTGGAFYIAASGQVKHSSSAPRVQYEAHWLTNADCTSLHHRSIDACVVLVQPDDCLRRRGMATRNGLACFPPLPGRELRPERCDQHWTGYPGVRSAATLPSSGICGTMKKGMKRIRHDLGAW